MPALTPALSPEERETDHVALETLDDPRTLSASFVFTNRRSKGKGVPTGYNATNVAPSPGGEGRGEGGRCSIPLTDGIRVPYTL